MIKNKKGFTLIELVVVIVILGILAAIGIPNYLSTINKAKEANVIANLKTMERNLMANIHLWEVEDSTDPNTVNFQTSMGVMIPALSFSGSQGIEYVNMPVPVNPFNDRDDVLIIFSIPGIHALNLIVQVVVIAQQMEENAAAGLDTDIDIEAHLNDVMAELETALNIQINDYGFTIFSFMDENWNVELLAGMAPGLDHTLVDVYMNKMVEVGAEVFGD